MVIYDKEKNIAASLKKAYQFLIFTALKYILQRDRTTPIIFHCAKPTSNYTTFNMKYENKSHKKNLVTCGGVLG